MTDLHAQLDALAAALRPLHKALLEHEAERLGLAPGSFQLLNLTAKHPELAWLRQLSQAMADLDARRDALDTPMTADDVRVWRRRIEGLVGPAPAVAPEFRSRYLQSLQDSVPVTSAHGALRAALQPLPQSGPT